MLFPFFPAVKCADMCHERNPEICLHYYINGLHLQTFSRKDQEYGAGGIGVPR